VPPSVASYATMAERSLSVDHVAVIFPIKAATSENCLTTRWLLKWFAPSFHFQGGQLPRRLQLTNGAAVREPWRMWPIPAQVAPTMLSLDRLENSVITAYRAYSALTKVHVVKQRVEKVRHKFPPPRNDFEI
jgi:hypothetical protein